jgi:hypothetical protein
MVVNGIYIYGRNKFSRSYIYWKLSYIIRTQLLLVKRFMAFDAPLTFAR